MADLYSYFNVSIVQALEYMPLNVGSAQSIMLARPRTGLARVGRVIVMLGIPITRSEVRQQCALFALKPYKYYFVYCTVYCS